MTYMQLVQFGISHAFPLEIQTVLKPVCLLLTVIAAYLIGSVNFGILISTKKYGQDIRELGSKNAGTTNMLRSFGKKAAIATLALDFFKGVIAAALGVFLHGYIGGYFALVFAVFGHAFPLYFHFKGGKGVATFFGCIALLNTVLFVVILGIYIFLVWVSKYSSLGSIISVSVVPLIISRWGCVGGLIIGFGNQSVVSGICTLCSLVTMILVLILHRKNIVRLWKGEESKVNFSSNKG